jgi:uncharacterized membrane protein (DUF441 family)
MSDFFVSLIRTWVPVGVGAVVAWLLTRGVVVDPETQAGVVIALTGVTQAVYYALARLLEKKWPVFGVLLGTRNTPTYGS